jgi:hypothetical protein
MPWTVDDVKSKLKGSASTGTSMGNWSVDDVTSAMKPKPVPKTTITPSGTMEIRPDVQKNLINTKVSVGDIGNKLKSISAAPKTPTADEDYWSKHPVMNFLANNPVSRFWDKNIVPFLDVQGAAMRNMAVGEKDQIPGRATTTGNKAADIAANISGGIMGLATPTGGGTALGGALKFGEQATMKGTNALVKGLRSISPKAANVAGKVINNPLAYRAAQGLVEDVPITAYQAMTQRQTPGEAAKSFVQNAPFTVGGELLGYGIGKGLDALRKPVAQTAETSTKGIPGMIGKQTPVMPDIDTALRQQQNLVDDLRYQRMELGADTTKAIEEAEKKLTNMQRVKNLPGLKKQLSDLETVQKQLFDEGKAFTPEYARVSENVVKLKKVISEVDTTGIWQKPRTQPEITLSAIDNRIKGLQNGTVKPQTKTELQDLMKKQKIIQDKFKVTTDTGPVEVDTKTFTDANGKTLRESMEPELKNTYDEIVKDLEGATVKPDADVKTIAQDIKDRSGFSYNIKDVYRNFKQAFGKNFDTVKKKYLDTFDASKKSFVDMQKKYTDDLYDNVVKKWNINKDTNESAAVQWIGEGKKPAKVTDPQTGQKVWGQVDYTLDDLKREFPDKWEKIVEADKWFRQKYNELIGQVNASRAKIYPNNPGKQVPYRQDYYRHFREMSDTFQGVKNLFETPSQIDPALAGISEFTKPRSKFAGFMQRRGLGAYKADAVGGFLDYIKAASYATHIDPQISVFRGLAKDIAEGTAKTRNANGFIKYLQDFANDLAGKTSKYDRWIQEDIPGGRTTFRAINWINSRVKANTVLGNVSSSLSQIANIPQGIAYVKNPAHLMKGAGQYMASIFDAGHAKLYKQSQFLSERFSSELYSRFDTKILDQPKKFAAWMLRAMDETGTKFIWSSTYNKAIAEGIENPVKYADDITRRMVAGRGVGEMALLQKSKLFQLAAPFQVEVGNLWHVMKDFVTEKDFSGLAMLFLANYALNKGMEQVRGSGVVFDPIGAMEDAFGEEDTTPLQKGGRLAGEVLSNIPLGQTVASALPENTRKELFGREDPTRYGGGLLAVKGLQDPLYKLAAPFGGSQAKKTIQGLQALQKGGVYQKNADGEYLKYAVDKTTGNTLKGVLFGAGGFPETRQYYNENQRPLSVQQTMTAQETGLQLKDLQKGIQLKRKLDNTKDKDPVKTEILQYYEKTGDTTVFTDSPQRTFTVDGESVKLTEEQYREYVKKINKYAKEQIEYSKKFDSYKLSDSATKYDFLRKAVNMAESRARKELNLK